MISAQEALTIILDRVKPLDPISLSLDRSRGCSLAEDIRSGMDIPPFDNAAMDGYAFRAEDISSVPGILTIIGEASAGTTSAKTPGKAEACLITTGALIPAGCTAVVQHEWTEKIDETHVKVLHPVPVGSNIRRAGGDIKKGALALERGSTMRPQEIGVLASLGKNFVTVYRRPGVAVVATGNELTQLNKHLAPGKIYNSNAHLLCALLEEAGAEQKNLGVARDTPEEIRSTIIEGLSEDMLITSGGVSAGKYDLVIDAMKAAGVEIVFWKVNIKPGMPIVFGMKGATPVFGLPGNPVSTMVTFLKFVKPAIQKLMGSANAGSSMTFRAVLTHEIKKTDGRRHYVRGILEQKDGKLVVSSTGSQVSNVQSSLVKANCLIILPAEQELVRAGGEVEIELL